MSLGLIVIPAYNEEKNIEKVLEDIGKLKANIDIVVINDGSSDNTRKKVQAANIPVISHNYNLGYGAALQTGFKYAVHKGYKYVIQFDSDGQHDAQYLLQMINELEKGETDIVIGSRFLSNGWTKTSLLKRPVIKFMRFLIKSATGVIITDPTSGFKGLSRKTFKYYSRMGNFPSDYPDADILIQMIRGNYKVREIPIVARERKFGISMHSGIKPAIYILKILLSISIILLRERFNKGV